MKAAVLLEIKNLIKSFPGITALNNVDLEIREGEVHGVIGENGAGKSTLCNIITGIYQPTKGDIYWEGKKVTFKSPKEALNAGIRMVYQERNLVPSLTGAQNIYLGNEITKKGRIDEKEIMSRVRKLQASLGIDVKVDVPVSKLATAERQLIEIMRALSQKPKLLILDEPTSSIAEKDVQVLFQVIKKIKDEGTSVIFISHKMEEIFSITDRISIFRDGQKVYTGDSSELSEELVIKHMINRDLSQRYPTVIPHAKGKLLETVDLGDGRLLHDINITVKAGEVVGFYGLVGSGRTELAELLFGLTSKKKGAIKLNGEELETLSPSLAIKNGVLLTPEDRKEHGLFDFFDIKKNATIPYVKEKLGGFMGAIKAKEEKTLAQEIAEKLGLVYKNLKQSVTELSGGNKQKIVIGKWLVNENMKLIIMDEPTQGIDVGTKFEIYILIRDLAKMGVGVIFISSELPELLGVCDRLYVFKEGTVVTDLPREKFDREKVLRYAL
jgi:ribose transport system ATP-binding protein